MGIRLNRAILDTSHKMTFCDTAQSVHKQVRLPLLMLWRAPPPARERFITLSPRWTDIHGQLVKSEQCGTRKSSPNLIAKCSEREGESANSSFADRSNVSIADLPVQKKSRAEMRGRSQENGYAPSARSKCDADLELLHDQNSSHYCHCCQDCGRISSRNRHRDNQTGAQLRCIVTACAFSANRQRLPRST